MSLHPPIKTVLAAAVTLLPALHGCTGNERQDSLTGNNTTATDSMSNNQIIVWKATHGVPVQPADIDSIIDYFEQADRWTGIHLSDIKSEAEFNTIDSLYLKTFPYMEIFSTILEENAGLITGDQMERMHTAATSLGKRIEEAAGRCNIPSAQPC